MAGTGTYTVKNNTAGSIQILDTDGNQKMIIGGSSALVSLSAAGYVQAVGLVGSANVVPVIVQPTYKYALLAQALVATPTDVIVIQGSATKTVNITKIKITGQATAQGSMPFQILRRLSTGGTIGSAVLTAIVPGYVDLLDPAPTAVVSSVGTANYTTVQTANGVLESGRLGMSALATGTAGDAQAVKLSYSDFGDQPIKLRGTTDYVVINFNGAAIPAGGVHDFSIETYEDNS